MIYNSVEPVPLWTSVAPGIVRNYFDLEDCEVKLARGLRDISKVLQFSYLQR